MLKASVRKTRDGFRGLVRCVDGKRSRWFEWAGIDRPSREDALEDALRRKADREATWGGRWDAGTIKTGNAECRVTPERLPVEEEEVS